MHTCAQLIIGCETSIVVDTVRSHTASTALSLRCTHCYVLYTTLRGLTLLFQVSNTETSNSHMPTTSFLTHKPKRLI